MQENCRFSGNGIGLEIYNSVNGWDITNNVLEACHVGIYAADATSILIEGSVIESVGVPIMLMVSQQARLSAQPLLLPCLSSPLLFPVPSLLFSCVCLFSLAELTGRLTSVP